MELQQRIELAKTLLQIAKWENEPSCKPEKSEQLGKCIWTDLDGYKRCDQYWTEFQAQKVLGQFYPYNEV